MVLAATMASFRSSDVFAVFAAFISAADGSQSDHARLRYRVGAWHAHHPRDMPHA